MNDVLSDVMACISPMLTERQAGFVEAFLLMKIRPELDAIDALQQMCGELEQKCDKLTVALSDANRSIEILTAPPQSAAIIARKVKKNRNRYTGTKAAEVRAEIIKNIEHMLAVGIPVSINRYNETFHPMPSVKVQYDRCGYEWNELVIAAGGTPNFSGKQYAAMKAAKTMA